MQLNIHNRIGKQVKFDQKALIIVALTIIVQGGAVLLYPHLESLTNLTIPEQQAMDITIAGYLVAGIIVESLFIVAVWRLWSLLPETLRKYIKKVLKYSIIGGGSVFIWLYGWREALIAAYVYAGVAWTLSQVDMKWLPFNTIAVGAGIGFLSFFAAGAGPPIAMALMVGLLIWDWFAVDLGRLMEDIIGFSTSVGIPNYLIIPAAWQIDFEGVTEWINGDGERPDGVGGIIGLGDFIIPGLLPVSAIIAVDSGVPVAALTATAGACLAALVLRAALDRREKGAPALPWLNTGSLIGFGIGLLFTNHTAIQAMGLIP